MLTFKEFRKSYNNELVIEIIDFSIGTGGYWLLGENGSGKSTLLKSIAGLIPFEGRIDYSGIADQAGEKRMFRKIVNYGQAEPAYPKFLKGADLVDFYRNTKLADKDQVKLLVKKLRVEAFLSKEMGDYSSGMMKKLSILLAFLGHPKLILLDEPLITLDTEAAGTVTELIAEYVRNGVMVIFTSHQELIPGSEFTYKKLLLRNHHLEAFVA